MQRCGILTVTLAGAVALIGPGCSKSAEPGTPGRGVDITIAPLGLGAAADACYTLSIYNEVPAEPGAGVDPDSLVWTRSSLCASQYGGEGPNGTDNGIRFTGICDADAEDGYNAIRLELDGLYSGDTVGDGTELVEGVDYVNPCPAAEVGENNGCILKAPCITNEDTKIEFDITVMLQARLGFFDTAVKFDDVFCAAKLDCVDSSDDDLLYLSSEGVDGPTAVLGFTCLGGSGEDIGMYLSDITISCGDGSHGTTVDTSAGPGNVNWTNFGDGTSPLFGAAINTGEGVQGSKYWNVLLGMNYAAAGPGETCRMSALGTVSETPLAEDGAGPGPWLTPSGTPFPMISWDVDLFVGDGRVCTRHPLNGLDSEGNDSGVNAIYTSIDDPEQIAHKLELEAVCPCWNGEALEELFETLYGDFDPGSDDYEFEVEIQTDGDETESEVEAELQLADGRLLFFGVEAEVGPGETEGSCFYSYGEADSTIERDLTSAGEIQACVDQARAALQDSCLDANGGCTGETPLCIYQGPGVSTCGSCQFNSQCAASTDGLQCLNDFTCGCESDGDCEGIGLCNVGTHQCEAP